MQRVLIAHQSTIPHYRVPFYEAINRLKPAWWEFGVVFDEDPHRRERLFKEPTDRARLAFTTVPTRTFFLELFGRRLVYQTFLRRAGEYDLIVLEDALYNLCYPLCRLWRIRGAAIAYWGHGKDASIARAVGWKRLAENVKRHWVRNCEGYFAYTTGVRDALIDYGVEPTKICVLHNTIDILAERSAFDSIADQRHELRRALGLDGRKILLLVGRLTKGKRLGFLIEAVQELRKFQPEYHLVVIGGGEQAVVESMRRSLGSEGVTYCGAIVDRSKLAEWYVSSDAYVHPGDVGLGVVQTLCYDLTPVVIDRRTHNPEYQYLNESNAVILDEAVSPGQYGNAIHDLCSDRSRWESYRSRAWASIKHLTIDEMAQNFVKGVNIILENR